MELGPDETDEPAQPLLAVLQGFSQRPAPRLSHGRRSGSPILVVMVVRFCFGMCTLVVLLLFQKYFTESVWIFRTGAPGIAEVLAVGAIGVFAGAVRHGTGRPQDRPDPLPGRSCSTATAVIVVVAVRHPVHHLVDPGHDVHRSGFAYQSSKVCMDSVVQADSDDAHVGRVFALYDTANNLCYVAAFGHRRRCWCPPTVPGSARSSWSAALFLIAGIGYGVAMARLRRGPARAGETHLLASSDETPVADPADGSPAAADGSPAQADRSQHS